MKSFCPVGCPELCGDASQKAFCGKYECSLEEKEKIVYRCKKCEDKLKEEALDMIEAFCSALHDEFSLDHGCNLFLAAERMMKETGRWDDRKSNPFRCAKELKIFEK